MNKIIKAAAVASLVLTSASAFAWGNGPFNGFTDMANDVFGDGFADGNANFNMSGSANGSGRGYGRGYDRFQGYNGYQGTVTATRPTTAICLTTGPASPAHRSRWPPRRPRLRLRLRPPSNSAHKPTSAHRCRAK